MLQNLVSVAVNFPMPPK